MKRSPWVAGALLLLAALATAQTTTTAEPSPPAASGPGFDIAECQTCHADVLFTNFQHSQHAMKLPGSCASCHGDVAAHAKMKMEGEEGLGPIISFKRLSATEINEKCFSCHDKARQSNWHGGVHERRGLSCTTCHSVHFFQSQRSQLRTARDTETCYSCHAQVRSQAMRQSHHPIREGKMECGSCHDPHSSAQKGMIKAESVNDLCYSCHADKRGPFLWEHPPARENCQNCHTVHGSNHERLLVAKQPWLCQRCHMVTRHPGTLYHGANSVAGGTTGSNRAVEHGCKNCHNQVHGTNHPGSPYLGR